MSIETTQQESEPDVAQLESLYERMLRSGCSRTPSTGSSSTTRSRGRRTSTRARRRWRSASATCSIPGDTVAATYRGHGAALALGVDQTALLAELLGRETGTNGGRGGSMNVISLEHGLIGCFGIVGGSIAAATGAALASQLQQGRHGGGRVLRRRRHEPGLLPRVPQLRGRAGAPDRLRLREQPVRRVDVDVPRDRRARHRRPGRGYGMPARRDRRQRRARRAGGRGEAIERARSGQGPTLLERRRTATRATRVSIPASTGPRKRSTSG